jgi:hypothetical protein
MLDEIARMQIERQERNEVQGRERRKESRC